MLLGGLFSVMASKFIGYPSAGALGCITIAFVARICWKRRTGIENVGRRNFNIIIFEYELADFYEMKFLKYFFLFCATFNKTFVKFSFTSLFYANH